MAERPPIKRSSRRSSDLKERGLEVITDAVHSDGCAGGEHAAGSVRRGRRRRAYPWRGRITCHPAPGRPGTPDKTATAAAQIAAFVGTAAPGHFALSGKTVVYSGPVEWSLRRMVLHQAYLAKAAGGVIGVRHWIGVARADDGAQFAPPIIRSWRRSWRLPRDVKAILGSGTKVPYAADWSEYFGHQPGDGSGDVYFHLDPLWASAVDRCHRHRLLLAAGGLA